MKGNVVFRQANINDCAVCSLASIIKYYGGIPNLEKLRELMHTTREGTNAYNIIECANSLGFKSKGLKVKNLNEFKDKNNIIPFIAHVIINKSYMHYVVIYKINYKNKTLKIMDPARGFVNISFDNFNKMWTNIILTFYPVKKIINLNKNNTFINLIKKILIQYKNILFIICFLFFISFLIVICNSFYLKYTINNINNNFHDNFKYISLIIFLLIIFKVIFDYLKNELITYLNCKIEFSLNTTTLSHIIKLPYSYFKTKTSGDIIARINDLNNIKNGIINFIINIIFNIIVFVISSIILFKISSNLFYITLVFLVLIATFEFIFLPFIKKNIDNLQINNSISTSYLLESINAFESIKAMNNHEKIILNYENKLIDYLNSKIRFEKILNKDNTFKNLFYTLSSFFIIFFGYKEILNNNLDITSFIFFHSLYSYFIDSFKSITSLIPDMEYYSKTIKRINDIFEIDVENFFEKNKNISMKLHGNIKFINVNYMINNTIEIFKNINITINGGSKIAIIGSTGSGKSTFLKLLLRYYKLNDGMILIDNKNILDYNIDDIRNNICYISQNETLFTSSIYNNIIMDKDINYDYFLKICKICEVDKIVDNKYLRYDYQLEENGFNISGGEKARIVLARGLLKSSNVYIFDEALKELDSASERRILRNVFKEFNNSTFLIVTHKMDNLNMFDNILYVNNKSINYVTDL